MNIGACSRGFGTVVGDCPRNPEASWLRRPFDGNSQTGSHPRLRPVPRSRTLFSCVVRTATSGQVAAAAPWELSCPIWAGRISTGEQRIICRERSQSVSPSAVGGDLSPRCLCGRLAAGDVALLREASGETGLRISACSYCPSLVVGGLAATARGHASAGRPGTTSAPFFSTETFDSLARG